MPHRSELFSLRNIITMALVVTLLFGAYSYHNLRSRANLSSSMLQTMRKEATHEAIQLRAETKAKMTCYKDLKQLQQSLEYLKSKLSESEASLKKEKSESLMQVEDLRKKMRSTELELEKLREELNRLKANEKASSDKSRQEIEESERKAKKAESEHQTKMTSLTEEVEKLRRENVQLKADMAGMQRKASPPAAASSTPRDAATTTTKAKRDGAPADDHANNQMPRPGTKRLGREKEPSGATADVTTPKVGDAGPTSHNASRPTATDTAPRQMVPNHEAAGADGAEKAKKGTENDRSDDVREKEPLGKLRDTSAGVGVPPRLPRVVGAEAGAGAGAGARSGTSLKFSAAAAAAAAAADADADAPRGKVVRALDAMRRGAALAADARMPANQVGAPIGAGVREESHDQQMMKPQRHVPVPAAGRPSDEQSQQIQPPKREEPKERRPHRAPVPKKTDDDDAP